MTDRRNDPRYDGQQRTNGSGATMNRPKMDSVEVLRQRLAANAWLSPAEIASLFGRKRHAAIGWMQKGLIRYQVDPSGYRTGNPEDVRKLLVEFDEQRTGSS